jgi:nucleoside-diphosphate kinase
MEKTFALIKPGAFENNLTGAILSRINEAGFRIQAIKSVKLNEEQAKELYGIHKEKPFYSDLIQFITSGKIIVMLLEKDNAIEDFRALIGNTDPSKAGPGTIRRLYGRDKTKNAVHASDSPENVEREKTIFFPGE